MSGFRLPPAAPSIAVGRSPSPSTASPISASRRQHRLCAARQWRPRWSAEASSITARAAIWGAWTEEPNAIVDVTRAGSDDAEPARDDRGRSKTTLPCARSTPRRPRPRIAPRFSTGSRAFLPAGFYYKTFLWPRWETFEPRSAPWPASAASIRTIVLPADNPQFNARCDLLVVGAGPAGLAAASAAARSGRVVFLLEDHAEIGGQLIHRGGEIEGGAGANGPRSVERRVEADGGRVMTSTTAFGVYDHNLVCAWERRASLPDALWRIRPQEIVIAAGAIERPLVVARQRPSGGHVGRRGARLSSPIRRSGRRAHRGRDQQRQRLSSR